MSRARVTAAVVGIVVAAALVLASACASDESASLWVDEMHRAHTKIDALTRTGRSDEAISVARAALALPVPVEIASDDRRVMHQDLSYRLAMLELDAGRAPRAVEAATLGLGFGVHRDVFSANLLVARGSAHEALGRPLEASADYHRALEINDALLARALRGGR